MDESEWLDGNDPGVLLSMLWGKASDRKLRLFACAFCRSIWTLLEDECFRYAVETAEQFADNQVRNSDLSAAKKASGAALERSGLDGVTGKLQNAKGCAWSTTRDVGSAAMYPTWVFATDNDRSRQVSLLRDIFGNPFLPVLVDSAWLTPAVQDLAQSIYDDRDFDRMHELADSLEAAGCKDEQILAHCRQPGPHVRGCWVVDLMLGKE